MFIDLGGKYDNYVQLQFEERSTFLLLFSRGRCEQKLLTKFKRKY